MNILFVHEVDWLNKVVFDIHNLAEILSARGHNVYAIDYPDTWKKDSFWDFGSLKTTGTVSKERAIPGASVTLRRPGFIKIPVLSRASAAITHYHEIKKTIIAKKIDVVMLYGVPTNGLQTLSIAKKLGIPVVFRSIDMLSGLVRNPLLSDITRYIEKSVYQRADAILAITPNHTRYVTELGAAADKVTLLPLPVDTGLFRPGTDYQDLRQKWGCTDKDKVIVFIGTLFHFSGLDEYLREFPRVTAKDPDAKLLIVGDGPQRKKLENIIKELDLGKAVTITGFQPYRDMPRYINLSIFCINPFLDTKETRDIFPGKIIQYIACGKAAIVTPLLGIKSLVPDETRGIIYVTNGKDMADKTIELLSSAARRKKIEEAGLEYIRQNHDQKVVGAKLENELARIVREHRKQGIMEEGRADA
jgi:glycosyltransferase involved in cell wall biosynthesis